MPMNQQAEMDPIARMLAAVYDSDCPFCIFVTYEADNQVRVLAQACEFHREELS